MDPRSPPTLGHRVVTSLKGALARLAGAPSASARVEAQASGSSPSRTTRQVDGDDAEAIARAHLECAGLVCVATNVRYRDGELDLVMREPARERHAHPTLVFVEVRLRRGGSHGGAAASIGAAKRRRLVAAAAHYLTAARLRPLPRCRFDVVAIDEARGELQVEWIRDAFRGEA